MEVTLGELCGKYRWKGGNRRWGKAQRADYFVI